jgi:hypothetical protein
MKKFLQSMTKEDWLIFTAVAALVYVITSANSKTNKRSAFQKVDKSKNYVIGDSQSPHIDWGSEKVSVISSTQGESSLWQGSKNLEWLNSAVKKYPVSPDVNSIVINIGTNDGYNQNKDIAGLVNNIKEKFPNAQLLAVQGSWGWGDYLKNPVSEKQVRAFYKKFKDLGVEIIEPPIGAIEPHGNKPVYKTIGASLDKAIRA